MSMKIRPTKDVLIKQISKYAQEYENSTAWVDQQANIKMIEHFIVNYIHFYGSTVFDKSKT